MKRTAVYVVGGFVFVPHPTVRGHWLKTDTSVIRVACSCCNVAVGIPCKDFKTGEYRAQTHANRREAARGIDIQIAAGTLLIRGA